jgi:hypothetical protein
MAHVSAVATGACVGVLATDVAGTTGAAGWPYCKVNNRSKYQKTVGNNKSKIKYKISFHHNYYTAHTWPFCM